jgi:multiple sugar transport system ATP-binding protein
VKVVARVYLEEITRQFGNTTAIADITFEIPDGQFWVLVGPSGCGKSTILRTIAGLEKATSGSLYIGDRLVNQVPARDRDVAMVFQNYALYPHMTVAENLAFGLKMRKTDTATIRDRVETVAKSLNIAHLLSRKPRQLSGGQQQRVALGRAIARQPQAFLLDEPLSNLDAQLRDDMRAELKQLHQTWGITTIYVTHDQVEAMTLADQIVVLDQGKIQQIDAPERIYAYPRNQMVATFLGNPPMNIVEATFDGKDLDVSGQRFACPQNLLPYLQNHPATQFNLGIRPEHVRIATEDSDRHLSAQVSVVEPLGRETLVRTTLPKGGQPATINLQIEPGHALKAGDRLSLHFDLDHLTAFDPTTGHNLLLTDRLEAR